MKKTPYMTLEDLKEFTLQYGDVYFHPVSLVLVFFFSPVYLSLAVVCYLHLISDHFDLPLTLLEHLSLC